MIDLYPGAPKIEEGYLNCISSLLIWQTLIEITQTVVKVTPKTANHKAITVSRMSRMSGKEITAKIT